MLCSRLEVLIRERKRQAFAAALQEIRREEMETPQAVYLFRCGLCGEIHTQEVSIGEPQLGSEAKESVVRWAIFEWLRRQTNRRPAKDAVVGAPIGLVPTHG